MLLTFVRRLRDSMQYRLAPYLPSEPVLKRPVFIVGCGRSGTSIIGRLLQEHLNVVYLHEPREVWLEDPRTDIWSAEAAARNGHLILKASDVTPALTRTLRRRFATAVWRSSSGFFETVRLVEKTPINGFRIPYIRSVFPDAQFIHIIRHGLEVAHSIGEVSNRWNWFGEDSHKWRLLRAVAERRGYESWVNACRTNVHRGALEWRLAVETVSDQFDKLPEASTTTLRYETLLSTPSRTACKVQEDVDLNPSSAVRKFAVETVERKTFSVRDLDTDDTTREIIKPLLRRFGYEW